MADLARSNCDTVAVERDIVLVLFSIFEVLIFLCIRGIRIRVLIIAVLGLGERDKVAEAIIVTLDDQAVV